jgi:arginine transport system substrate-binding protein
MNFHAINQLQTKAVIRTMMVALSMGLLALTTSADPTYQNDLKVLVLKNSPSMSYRDSQGNLEGFSVDLAKALCAQIKAQCTIEEVLLSEIIDHIALGNADFSTSELIPTPERQLKVRFTEQVRQGKSFWFGKKTLQESKNFNVVVVNGSTQQQWAKKMAPEYGWKILPVKTNADVASALLSHVADATALPTTTTLSLVREGKVGPAGFSSLHQIDDASTRYPVAIPVTPTKSKLLHDLNEALSKIKSNGELEELNSKHFSMRIL